MTSFDEALKGARLETEHQLDAIETNLHACMSLKSICSKLEAISVDFDIFAGEIVVRFNKDSNRFNFAGEVRKINQALGEEALVDVSPEAYGARWKSSKVEMHAYFPEDVELVDEPQPPRKVVSPKSRELLLKSLQA